MITFKDIEIIDLEVNETQRDSLDKDRFTVTFILSDKPPYEWGTILKDICEEALSKESRWPLDSVTRIRANPHVYGGNIIVSEREQYLEKCKEMLDECVAKTNAKYRQHLGTEADDRKRISSLRGRLFGKKNR